tara:strand:+ start:174 stop:332 length:159 start_codon:yes stop_codon:yes gene_type:complete
LLLGLPVLLVTSFKKDGDGDDGDKTIIIAAVPHAVDGVQTAFIEAEIQIASI